MARENQWLIFMVISLHLLQFFFTKVILFLPFRNINKVEEKGVKKELL